MSLLTRETQGTEIICTCLNHVSQHKENNENGSDLSHLWGRFPHMLTEFSSDLQHLWINSRLKTQRDKSGNYVYNPHELISIVIVLLVINL